MSRCRRIAAGPLFLASLLTVLDRIALAIAAPLVPRSRSTVSTIGVD